VIEQADTTMVGKDVGVVSVLSQSSTLDVIETQWCTGNQVRANMRIVPGLDNSSESKIAG